MQIFAQLKGWIVWFILHHTVFYTAS